MPLKFWVAIIYCVVCYVVLWFAIRPYKRGCSMNGLGTFLWIISPITMIFMVFESGQIAFRNWRNRPKRPQPPQASA